MENNETTTVHPMFRLHVPTCEVCLVRGTDVAPVIVGATEYLLCDTCTMAVEDGEHTLGE